MNFDISRLSLAVGLAFAMMAADAGSKPQPKGEDETKKESAKDKDKDKNADDDEAVKLLKHPKARDIAGISGAADSALQEAADAYLELRTASNRKKLVGELVKQVKAQTTDEKAADLHVAVHVVRYSAAKEQAEARETAEKALAATPALVATNQLKLESATAAELKEAAKVDQEAWFLLRRVAGKAEEWESAPSSTRIYGTMHLGLLFVHLNALTTGGVEGLLPIYRRVVYRSIVTQKLPANIDNLLGVVSFITGQSVELAALRREKRERIAVFGFGMVEGVKVPSDISLFGVGLDRPEGKAQLLGKPITIDNEGKYRWDASIGVPFTKLTALQYSQESGQFNAREINKQSVYGLFNLYLKPVDLKERAFTLGPVIGFGLTGRPGDRFMAGLSVGIPQVQLFGGYNWTRTDQPEGTTVKERYRGAWVIGLNVPVKAAIKQFAAQKKEK